MVKAFINLIGIYPVGTCVILDTYEIAIVHAANADVAHVHRPIVRVVATPEGGPAVPRHPHRPGASATPTEHIRAPSSR